jgi:hypothetical protein
MFFGRRRQRQGPPVGGQGLMELSLPYLHLSHLTLNYYSNDQIAAFLANFRHFSKDLVSCVNIAVQDVRDAQVESGYATPKRIARWQQSPGLPGQFVGVLYISPEQSHQGANSRRLPSNGRVSLKLAGCLEAMFCFSHFTVEN